MTPLPLPNHNPTNRTIHIRPPASSNDDPTQRLITPKTRSCVYRYADKDITSAVYNHQGVDEVEDFGGSGGGQVELEEGEGVEGVQEGVDAEGNPDCAEAVLRVVVVAIA
jgi:hypothetical protein